MSLSSQTATSLKRMLRNGETSCVEVMSAVLETIAQRENQVGAFISIRDRAELLAEAESVDRRRLRGEKIGPLAGLPVAIKDNICTRGIATTCASKMLENFVPPYDATVVRRIREADGIVLGKTNLDEFAMGSTTENSALKVTRNPHDLERVPGGTSGGSAAAVAANETILAIGSDTGGSIRQPASFCGVVGMKPTYGRVSRYGLIAYGSSLDQIGPLARSVEDVALLLGVLAGHDEMDSTSLDEPVPDYLAGIDECPRLRIGVPEEYFGPGLDAEVRSAIQGVIDRLARDGHEIVPIRLPHTEYAIATYYLIACAEASSNLARYDGAHYGLRSPDCKNIVELYTRTRDQGFGDEVKRRILLGTFVLSAGFYDAYYLKASKVRTLIRRDFEQAFTRCDDKQAFARDDGKGCAKGCAKGCDVILTPVAPTPAYKIGEMTQNPLEVYLGDIYSVIANLTGLPAISIPCGQTKDGLPIGVQLTGGVLQESALLRVASQLG